MYGIQYIWIAVMIELVDLEINHQKVKVEEGSSIIEAADKIGVYIPRFCYHKKLSIAANCRMCLVEVGKVGKPLPACATPVTSGMQVLTQSPKAANAQRAVMEFLLINHPLDCPICDQGGECELQDLAMGFGRDRSAYEEAKRSVLSENIGPLVETSMTRCIQCTRCVRFGAEIAGMPELGVMNRGEKEEISTYVKHMMRSELSGNIIDLCPVGALVNKPARYQGRGFEYREHPMIGAHDCVGSHLFLHTRAIQTLRPQREVMRVVPREHDSINETWISDRDRYSHFGLYDKSRLYQPRIKKRGKWVEVSWQDALAAVVEDVETMIEDHGADCLAALASPNSTIEECYLLQKLMRQLGTNNIDHRLHWQDFSDQADMPRFPNLGCSIQALEKLDVILLIGSNVRLEQPLIAHRLYQASLEGAKIIAINAMDYDFQFDLYQKIIVSSSEMVPVLMAIALGLGADIKGSIPADMSDMETIKTLIQVLYSAQSVGILIGQQGLAHAHAAQIRALAQLMTRFIPGHVGLLTEGANSAGAWLAGALPHRTPDGQAVSSPGLDAKAIWRSAQIKGYFLLNIEPELDCAFMGDAKESLDRAERVVCFTPFVSPAMEAYANIILPIAPFVESDGTFVNVEGRWQSFLPVSEPTQSAQPAWKVLRLLGALLKLDGFQHKTIADVRDELKQQVQPMSMDEAGSLPDAVSLPTLDMHTGLTRLAAWPMYCVDNIVRRAEALQETLSDSVKSISMNQKTASSLQLKANDLVIAAQGESQITLALTLDDRLADHMVWFAAGLASSAGFGQVEAAIQVERIDD